MTRLSLKGVFLFVSAVVLASPSVADRLASIDLEVKFRAGADPVVSSQCLPVGYGKMVRGSGRDWVLRLSRVEGLGATVDRIRGRRTVESVVVLRPEAPTEAVRSAGVDSLSRFVAEYKECYREFEAYEESQGREIESGEEEDEGEVPGLDFLEAYLQWKRDRAYPNQQVDLSGYLEAIEKRAAAGGFGAGDPKRPERGGQGRQFGISPTTIQGNWVFVGPRNLSIPYRTYYGQSPINGRINGVAIDPTNPNIYYVGGSNGGVWKSNDAGSTWAPLGDSWPSLGVSSIAVSPSNPNLVLAGTGDFFGFDVAGIGVMRSTNGGSTWTRVGTNIGAASIPKIAFDPDNPNIVYCVSGRSGLGDVYRSTDAGATWVASSIPNGTWADVSVGASNGTDRTVWAVGDNGTDIYRSNDQGGTWVQVTVPGITGAQNPLAIAASKVNYGTAYILTTSPTRKIYKTVDNGATWTDVTVGFPNGSNNYNWSQGWYDYHITTSYLPSTSTDVVYVGLIDVVISVDGGATWRNTGGANYTATYSGTAITHNDQHCFTVDPSNPNNCLVGNDGGAYRLLYDPVTDTVTWTRLSANLGVTQFYTMDLHPTNASYIKGGTQDNATPHSFGNLASWGNPGAGDGAGCAINQTNPNFQYNSSQFHGLEKTTNAYSSSSGFSPGFGSDSVPFIGGMWLDPNDQGNLYVNTNYLWRYDEDTDTWVPRLGGQLLSATARVDWVAVAPGNSNRIYTGSGDGELWMSTNFGATWTQIDRKGLSGGLPNSSISSISVSPTNQADILVGYYGSGSRIYRCTNTNAAAPTYVAVNGTAGNTVPNVALNTIERDPWSPGDTWYVGTDVGVYMTRNSGTTWTDITQSRGLPSVQVSRLIANRTTGYLNAATFGRGIWRMKIVPADVVSVTTTPSVVSGDGGNGSVTIDRPAPSGGMVVQLGSSNPGVLQVPVSVTVPAGSTVGNFVFTTAEVGTDTNVTVTATVDSVVTDVTSVLAAPNLTLLKLGFRQATGVTGGIGSLGGSDDNRLVWNLLTGHGTETVLNTVFRPVTVSPSVFRVELEFHTSVAGLPYRVMFFNWATNSYEQVGSGTTSGTDQKYSFTPGGPLSRFLSNDLTVALVVDDPGGANGSYQVRVDRVRVRSRS